MKMFFDRRADYLKMLYIFLAVFLGQELCAMEIKIRVGKSNEDYYFAEELIQKDLSYFTYQCLGSTFCFEESRNYLRNRDSRISTVTKICSCKGERAGFITYTPTGIVLLAVAEKFREKGYGRKLIDSALNDARDFGSDRVIVSVKTDNEVAIKFYEKCGFKYDEMCPSGEAFRMKLAFGTKDQIQRREN